MTAVRPAAAPAAPSVKATPVFHVPIGKVRPNPDNPRSDLGDLTDLVESIGEYGVLQPPLARMVGDSAVLITGARRLAASRLAGRQTFPVIPVSERLTSRSTMVALVENLHREAMSPMDEARACRELIAMGMSKADVAVELARSGNWVADRLALLELDTQMQRQVDSGQLALGKAAQIGHLLRKRQNGTVDRDSRAPRPLVKSHPLAAFATAMCDEAGHSKLGRVGPACGQCWEQTIRLDEREKVSGSDGVARWVTPVGIDEIKIERAMAGERIELSRDERLEVIDRLSGRGKSAAQIGRLLRTTKSNIEQLRVRYLGSVDDSIARHQARQREGRSDS